MQESCFIKRVSYLRLKLGVQLVYYRYSHVFVDSRNVVLNARNYVAYRFLRKEFMLVCLTGLFSRGIYF